MTGPLRVPLWGVSVTTPEVSAAAATVKVAVELANDATIAKSASVRVRLEPVGAGVGAPPVSGSSTATVPAAGLAAAQVAIEVASPRLWSPDSPALYRAVVEVVEGGGRRRPRRRDVRDPEGRHRRRARAAGQRQAVRDEGRVRAPRQRPARRGGHRPRRGAPRRDAEGRRLQCHPHLRTTRRRRRSSTPADRLGMLVIDEAFDMWERPKNPQDYHRLLQRVVGARPRRDGAPRPQPPERRALEHRQRDPRAGRPAGPRDREAADRRASAATTPPAASRTRSAASGTTRTGRGPTPMPPSRSSTWAATTTSGSSTRADHARFPRRRHGGNGVDDPRRRFDYWSLVVKLPYVIGDFVWTGIDYLGESGLGRPYVEGDEPDEFAAPWPWHVAGCGDIDILGERKPQSYYREALWRPRRPARGRPPAASPRAAGRRSRCGAGPTSRATGRGRARRARTLRVAVYSSCERVALSLDGEAGRREPRRPSGDRPPST